MRDVTNTIDVVFYDDVGGKTAAYLYAWMELCCGTNTSNSRKQNSYSGTGYIRLYDTTGREYSRYRLTAMWPTSMTPPSKTESSAPAEVNAQFSFDFVDLESSAFKGKGSPSSITGMMQAIQQGRGAR
jgi:hypothetical protein